MTYPVEYLILRFHARCFGVGRYVYALDAVPVFLVLRSDLSSHGEALLEVQRLARAQGGS